MDRLVGFTAIPLNRLERTKVKYINSVILFLIFLVSITTIIDFNSIQEVENIDLSNNDISNISVNLIDANVSLSTTVDKDIKIEHIYSKEDQTSNLYTYKKGDTLVVNEYPYNKSNLISKKETVNIYIPEEYNFKQLDITTKSGQVNVDSLKTGKLNIKTETGNVDIAGVEATNMALSGNQYGVSISNVIIEQFESALDKMEMSINNSIMNNVNITSKEKSKLRISGLVTQNTNISGANTTVDLTLNDQLGYVFNTPTRIGNSELESTDNGYTYTAKNSKSTVTYNIPEAKAVSVVFDSVEDDSKEDDKDE